MNNITIDTPWGVVGNELTGDEIEAVIKSEIRGLNQKITDALNTVNVGQLDDLTNLESLTSSTNNRTGLFNLLDNSGIVVGKLFLFSDNAHHTVVQYLISLYSPDAPPSGNTHENFLTPMYRCWSLDGVHGPKFAWSEWRSVFAEHFTELVATSGVITEDGLEQFMGHKTNRPMSQNAVTGIVDSICEYLGLCITEDQESGVIDISGEIPAERLGLPITMTERMGYDPNQIMSQRAVTKLVRALGNYLGLVIVQNESGEYEISGTIPSDKVQN